MNLIILITLQGFVIAVCTDEAAARALRLDELKQYSHIDLVPIKANESITCWDGLVL